MTAQILPFISSGPRYGQVIREARVARVSSHNSAGAVAVAPSGHAAVPASFSSFSGFMHHEDTPDDLGVSGIVSTKLVKRGPKGGDLLTRAEQISRDSLVAKRDSADLLARLVQFRDSVVRDVNQSMETSWKRQRVPTREKIADYCGVGI